jgi:NAD(P)-dependent dehydrogenase (short-subunit alcohol dehydrogenase family)
VTAAESGFTIELAASEAFARLSGDFNPLHLDPVRARRTPFGSTVVHGIHLVLRTLDQVGDAARLRQAPAKLVVKFSNPVRTGVPVHLRATTDGARLKVVADAGGKPAYTLTVDYAAPTADAASAAPCVLDAPFGAEPPTPGDFPPTAGGTTPLRVHAATLSALFPALAPAAGRGWLADVLATTRVVGMLCPGLDSIYSTLTLQSAPVPGSDRLRYDVDRTDARFRMVRLALAGSATTGTLEAFYRPKPVAQRALREMVADIAPDEFAPQRALVVGGSRGLGETAAKILAAGGAEVTVTYVRGAEDAARVVDEAIAAGRRCRAARLDVAALRDEAPAWLAPSAFTHVYFFASPSIEKNPARAWNHPLFVRFASVYVDAFVALAERVAETAGPGTAPSFFFPSSVFVATPERGFVEYAAAKAAGEVACAQLATEWRVKCAAPRLPRMKTDQTNGLVDVGALDSYPVLLDALRAFAR